MSEIIRFIKFIPSVEAMYLLKEKGHAFRLLTIIAESARRYDGGSDGLKIGETFIGGYENYDMTESNYRSAKDILIRRSHVEIVETCRTRKKVTTGVTTVGTKVKLLSSSVYDINLEEGHDRKDDRPTTDPRPTHDILRMIRMNKNNKDHHPYPSSKILPIGDDDDLNGLTDDFSSNENLKENKESSTLHPQVPMQHNMHYLPRSPKIEVYSGVFLTQDELDCCISIKGSLESVQHAIGYVLKSPGRKSKIYDWPNTLSKWNIKDDVKMRIIENEEMAKRVCQTFVDFKDGNGTRCYMHNDKMKDQKGILFESESPYIEAIFITLIDPQFKEKVNKSLRDRKMQKGRVEA